MKRFTHHRVRLPHNSCLGDQSHILPSPGVSRHLPAELLASIFISIAHDSYLESYIHNNYCYSTLTVPSWVNVSYVCRYWRDVALNCPTLWSYIPTMPQRWTQELLARSQMIPLKISTRLCDILFYPSQEQMAGIVEQVMNHSQRIQKLRLDVGMVSHATGYPILSRFLFTRLPCLQHLEISDFVPQPEERSWSLFEENTPALRTLRSTCCSIRWHALGPSVLTTLHLFNARIVLHHNTMADFLAVLRRMPHLVQLSVEGSLPSARDFLSREFDATPIISLSHLSNMTITMAPLSAAIALLSCVDIPLRTKVRLEVLPEYTSEDIHISTLDDYVRLASLLGQRISQSDSPNFRSLIMGNPWEFALAFSTSERRVDCYFRDSFSSIVSDDILLKVNFVGDLPMRCSEPDYLVLSRIYNSIPLTKIQSVHFLPVGPSVSFEFWRDLLASLSNVQHLSFSLHEMPNITPMFSLPFHHLARNRQDGRSDGGQGEIFVPALEELELYQTTLERVRGRRNPNPSVADLQTLYDAISTRKETHCRLTIKECRLMTDGGVIEDLESVGWWEGDQFRITSNVRYACGCWKVARQACSLLWSKVLLLRSILLVCLCGLWRKILS